MALVADLEGGTVVGEDGVLGEDMAGCFVELVVGFGGMQLLWLVRLLECLMACWNVASLAVCWRVGRLLRWLWKSGQWWWKGGRRCFC